MKLFVTLPIVLLFTGSAYAECSGLPQSFCQSYYKQWPTIDKQGKKGKPNGVKCDSQNNAPGGNFKGCVVISQDSKTKEIRWCCDTFGNL
ncbi:hypothetical protein HYFRA_00013041 [Hymenoscyphus fraxineus]|uniref:Secreted protein n=1 Tax=Hymenoscyphus fraxineus TaxID=746836 RepID=A0A9N9PZ24_9HELO|nr:hypothetical protein HYFRA_00013041 [Hymenoscyphus fraxineus]